MSAIPAKKALYCVAFTRFYPLKKEWIGDFQYLHADNALAARQDFLLGLHPIERYTIQITGIAPVVGYWASEDKQKNLIITV